MGPAAIGATVLGGGLSAYGDIMAANEKSRNYKFSADQSRKSATEIMKRLETNKTIRESQGLQDRTGATISAASSGFSAQDYSTAALGASLQMQLADITNMTTEAVAQRDAANAQAAEYDRAAKSAKAAGYVQAAGSLLGAGGKLL